MNDLQVPAYLKLYSMTSTNQQCGQKQLTVVFRKSKFTFTWTEVVLIEYNILFDHSEFAARWSSPILKYNS